VYPKHFVGQALRRAFLCGTDQISGNSYEHRRQWIEDKLLELASIFALDICAYALCPTITMWCSVLTKTRRRTGVRLRLFINGTSCSLVRYSLSVFFREKSSARLN